MPPALPHDVWLNIADFLPTLALRALYPVNASLLHIALDARYRQVSFIYWDDRLLRNLIRLSDPYVARFVKILYIYPGFLKEAMDREALNKSNEKDKEREKPSFHDRLADITHQLQDKVLALSRCQTERPGAEETRLHKLPPKDSMRKLRERLKTAQDVMHAVLDLLRSLPSLTDYYITWYGLPTTSFSLTSLAVPCLSAPLLSPSLSKLSLDISLENLESLCSASFHVARLEHLHLHLHSDHTLSPDSLTLMLNAKLARSFSSLAPYLRSLSIEAHEPIDIGPLLAGLDLLGKLDTLALALPLQKPHLGNPKALGRFLRSQAHTIKVLRLRVTQHDSASTGPGSHWRRIGPADPWSLNSWARTAFGTEAGGDFREWFDEHDVAEPLGEYEMDALESLEISSNLLPLETALYCAERFGGKVQTLNLLGSTKSFEFVKELIKVLKGEKKLGSLTEEDEGVSKSETLNVNTNLRTLRLGPVALSPQLLDLLAHNLSNLRHLRLIVKHFLPSQDAVPIYGSSRTRGDGDGVQLEEQVYEFLETMQNDWSWPWWGLKTISVYSDSATLSSPLSPPLLARQPALSPQETTPTMPLPVVSFRARSSKVSSLPPSFTSSTSSTTTITGKSDPAATSTLASLPKISVSAPITRYPTPSASAPPHPSSLLDLPSSYSTGALPLSTSLNTEASTLNAEPSSPSSLTPAPTLHLSSISTPSSPIGASYDISPVSYISLPSASTSALPAPSSYAYMRDGDDEDDDVYRKPATSHEGHGMRPSTIRKPPRSHFATLSTSSSSPLSSSTVMNTSGSAISSSSSTTTPTSRGSHHHMFAFLRSGPRSRKEKGVRVREKKNMNVDNTFTSASSHPHLAPLPVRSSSNGSGAGGERQKMRPLVMAGHSTHSQEVSERALRNSNCQWKTRKSAVGVGITTLCGKEKGSSSRREDETAIATVDSSTRPATRISTSTLEEIPVNSTTVQVDDVDCEFRMNDKARKKEKRKSSGLYALAVRVKDHNRYWQKDYSRSSPSSASVSPVMTTCSASSQQREADRAGVEREKDLIQWEWEREREREREQRQVLVEEKKRRPLASFGSFSSMSGLSEYSTGGGGGRSTSDEGDASFTSSKRDGYGSSVGEEEERITLEVALDEILGRCLPGVRVVR